MSIDFVNVTKKVRLGAVKVTYEDLNIHVPDGVNVALLGRKQAGMEAIVNLICGADAPDRGQVSRTESISWPIPSASFIARHLTLAANARFVARLYEIDEEAYIARLADLGQFGDALNTRVEECPNDIRSLLCFFAGVCLPFDRYIFTNLGAANRNPRASALLDELRERASFLIVGQDIKNAAQLCTQAYVFNEGVATHYDDMEAAAEHFNSIEAQDVDEDDFLGSDKELADLVNVDF